MHALKIEKRQTSCSEEISLRPSHKHHVNTRLN